MSAGRVAILCTICATLAFDACSRRSLVRQYEYEEEIHLALDGSADVIVNASVPALVALRGAPFDAEATARFDRAAARQWFDTPSARVTRVSRPWRRNGRRFVQVRIETRDVRTLPRSPALAWSTYHLHRDGQTVVYTQSVGPPGGKAPAGVNWNGDELFAVRIHLPSRIQFHNAPSREVERGNILTWEQPLRERLAGRPLAIEVRMDERSILRRTLTVFGIAVSAALLLLAGVVWWVARRGRPGV